jgi:hypothetical protein
MAFRQSSPNISNTWTAKNDAPHRVNEDT